jgi:V8-like Glu-specific endopeptidase
MGKSEPGSYVERVRSPRRSRRRAALALTAGMVLGLGALATTNSSADTRLLHILNVSKSEPVAKGSAAQASAAPSGAAATGAKAVAQGTATASSSSSASAPASGSGTSGSGASGSSVTPAPKASATATPGSAPSTAAKPVSAPPTTALGESEVLTASEQPSQVGALFSGGLSGSHHCTASVVDSPAGDVIVTAGHCLTSGTTTNDVFVPGYRDGSAPYGVWQISSVVQDSAWTSSQDPDDDVSFAVVEPLNGRSLESVVGSYTLGTSGVTDSRIQITGYPESTDEPLSCTGDGSAFTSTQLQIYCTNYTDGTSGSGWISGYDPTTGAGTLIGVIGGYETGGDTADVSYSPVFGSAVRALYDQTISLAG